MLSPRVGPASPLAGINRTDAIAATVIGGTSPDGRRGSIAGTLIRAFIIQVLRNGLNLLNITQFQNIVIGAVIVATAF